VNNDFIKATSLLLNPVGYPMRVAEKWWTLRKTKREQGESRRTDLERLGQRGLFSSRAFVLRKAAPAPEPASP
jgi:hypothetical protein